jgi:hypothetical protein
LVVLRVPYAQHDLPAFDEKVVGQEVAALGVRAVGSKCIDLVGGINPANEAMAIPSRRVAADNDDLAVPRSPLALNTNEPPVQVEQHVVAAAFPDGPIDVDPEHRRVKNDRLFRDVAFLIGRQHHATDATRSIG